MKSLFDIFKGLFYSIYKHNKRGSEYVVVTVAELQDASGNGLKEGDKLVIYLEENGKAWAREISEFSDGRFELVGNIPKEVIKPNAFFEISKLFEKIEDNIKRSPYIAMDLIRRKPVVIRLYANFKQNPELSVTEVARIIDSDFDSYTDDTLRSSILSIAEKYLNMFKEFSKEYEALYDVSDN